MQDRHCGAKIAMTFHCIESFFFKCWLLSLYIEIDVTWQLHKIIYADWSSINFFFIVSNSIFLNVTH